MLEDGDLLGLVSRCPGWALYLLRSSLGGLAAAGQLDQQALAFTLEARPS